MGSREGDLERSLRRALERIDGTAETIRGGDESVDPDALARELLRGQRELEDTLARLMADPLRGAAAKQGASTELSAFTVAVADELLSDCAIPLCLRVTKGPPVALPAGEPNQAAARRLVAVGVAHAGWNGVVIVSPRTIGGAAALELVARPGAEGGPRPALPPAERCQTLADFIAELGGALDLRVGAAGELTARLAFRAPS